MGLKGIGGNEELEGLHGFKVRSGSALLLEKRYWGKGMRLVMKRRRAKSAKFEVSKE